MGLVGLCGRAEVGGRSAIVEKVEDLSDKAKAMKPREWRQTFGSVLNRTCGRRMALFWRHVGLHVEEGMVSVPLDVGRSLEKLRLFLCAGMNRC